LDFAGMSVRDDAGELRPRRERGATHRRYDRRPFRPDRRALCERDALIVRHQQVRWTYRELKERVDTFAASLLVLGLKRGDRIGVWSPNNAEWVITQFATAKAGLILVNINPAYRLTELEYALDKAGCVALITATRFKTSNYIGMLRKLAPELSSSSPGNLQASRLPELRLVITIGADPAHGTVRFGSKMSPISPVMPSGIASPHSLTSCNSTTR
jgi:non-ribosomal peptide synthetase component F